MTSRRELYAHGEPFGDSATRRKIDGKGYVCGFGGDSSSSSSNTTNNYDKRVVTRDGFGLSGDGNAVTMNTTTTTNVLDGDAIRRAFNFGTDTTERALDFGDNALSRALNLGSDTTERALDFGLDTTERAFDSVDSANATLGDGYERLIEASADVFNQGQNLIGQTQKAVADAYGQAQADKSGTIDNRTLIALAAAGAVAAVIIARK